MSYQFTYNVTLNNGKSFKIREITFAEYKNICKAIFNEANTGELNKVFNSILANCLVEDKPLNLLEKIIILLNIRDLTLGKEIKMTYNNATINLNTGILISRLDIGYSPFEYEHNGMILTFGLPSNFVITNSDAIRCVCESLIQIKNEDQIIPLDGLTEEEKSRVMVQFPGLPIVDIFKQIFEHYKTISLKFPMMGDFEFNLFDATFLHFFKFIFDEKFDSVLELEYNLRKHLNFNSDDFKSIPYPEAKIMLNKLSTETKEQAKNANGGNMNLHD